MRLFAAIPLSEEAGDALDRVAGTIPAGNLLPEENWHITLAFAADMAEEVAEDFALGLSELVMDQFAWNVDGFGVFGGDKPRQIHALIRPGGGVMALEAKVRRVARDAGLVLPHRRFVPHVTLSRLRGMPLDRAGADWLATHATRALGPFVAEHVALIESDLHRDGPRYTTVLSRLLG